MSHPSKLTALTAGPPPPHVPEGWKAVWNEQYSEYFYVNLLTKKSQWELPEAPATATVTAGLDTSDAPPYDSKNALPLSAEKTGSNTGDAMFGGGPSHKQDIGADEAYARKLQAEEDARSYGGAASTASDRGATSHFYQQGGAPGTYGTPQQTYGQSQQHGQPQQYPPQQSYGQDQYAQQQQYAQQPQQTTSSKGAAGFLGKLLGKGKQRPTSGGYYPPQHPHPNYYQQQQMYPQPGRRPGGGMGMGTGMALGAGGGLLGGVLLGEALEGHDGGDDGGYGGDDGGYGGGDGGGDFGGHGGGDFGGGDF
ncbi:hypothetical protein E2P81_ATG09964 [Venturia nashicola]|uniref:WW domain-containing protein n=1 Tax=Venturia nashicola TaxID=86259 RepID=A0A4Z1NZU3_9PEZI|nr:hypothetical protein E6O75_ATG10184 [Venturia nashicola]TLD18666.1 hypothetical protein E2P81_ATG09964 [Venturia nashicola]